MKKSATLGLLFLATIAQGAAQRPVAIGWSQADAPIRTLWDGISRFLSNNVQNPYGQWPQAQRTGIDDLGSQMLKASKPLYDFLTTLYGRFDSLQTADERRLLIANADLTIPMLFGTGRLVGAQPQPARPSVAQPQPARPAAGGGARPSVSTQTKLALVEIKRGLEADLANGESYKVNYARYQTHFDFASEAKKRLVRISTLQTYMMLNSLSPNPIQIDEKLSKDLDENIEKTNKLLITYHTGGSTDAQAMAAFDASTVAINRAIAIINRMIG